MRILFLAYGHPAFAAGGAQLMASEMNRAAREAGHETRLIVRPGGIDSARVFDCGGALAAQPGEPGLVYFRARAFDDEMLSASDSSAYTELRTYIERFRPDVAHFHHYLRLGVEAIVAARLAAPGARISLTFHEMLAICPANGQMVKPRTREICTSASPAECAWCVPARSAKFFAWRESRLKAALGFCDAFVFPSQYLRERYVDWGLEAAKCVVIPNGVAHPRADFDRSRRSVVVNRFAFFGQLIDNKGVDVALSALAWLAEQRRIPATGVEFEINGANRRFATPAYLKDVDALMSQVSRASRGRIRIVDRGEYQRDDLCERMASIDWVIVPSTWAESFALVVSEAWMFGRPVIATAIGGLAERVRDGIDGFTFPLRDARSLGELIAALCGDVATWERMSAAITPPPTPAEMLAGYARLWGEARTSALSAP